MELNAELLSQSQRLHQRDRTRQLSSETTTPPQPETAFGLMAAVQQLTSSLGLRLLPQLADRAEPADQGTALKLMSAQISACGQSVECMRGLLSATIDREHAGQPLSEPQQTLQSLDRCVVAVAALLRRSEEPEDELSVEHTADASCQTDVEADQRVTELEEAVLRAELAESGLQSAQETQRGLNQELEQAQTQLAHTAQQVSSHRQQLPSCSHL